MVLDLVDGWVDVPAKQAARGIAEPRQVAGELIGARRGVAVLAAVGAGVRPSDVDALDAAAFLALGLVLCKLLVARLQAREPAATDSLEYAGVDASRVLDAVALQVDRLRARVDRHAVLARYGRHALGQEVLLFGGYAVGAHGPVDAAAAEVVLVDEADRDLLGRSIELGRDRRERAQLVLGRVLPIEQNRVEAPHDPFGAYHDRQLLEGPYKFAFVPQARLDIPAVRREGELEVVAVVRERIQLGQHWSRVLRPEDDAVDDVRGQAVSADLRREYRVADVYEALADSVQHPVAMEPWDVRPSACADNHSSRSLEYQTWRRNGGCAAHLFVYQYSTSWTMRQLSAFAYSKSFKRNHTGILLRRRGARTDLSGKWDSIDH